MKRILLLLSLTLGALAHAQVAVPWKTLTSIPSPTVTASGDATGTVTLSPSGGATLPLTLSASGASAGTYRSVTVDTKGRVTAGTNPTTLAGYGITDAQPLDGDLSNIATLTTTSFGRTLLTLASANNTVLTTDGSGNWVQATTLPIGLTPAFSGGDVTKSAGSGTLTLAASGATAGTYKSVTIDAKGRVTAGTNPKTLAGYGITDTLTAAGLYTRRQMDALYFDGATAGTRIYWPLGAAGDGIGAGRITVPLLLQVPAIASAGNYGLWQISFGNTSYGGGSWSLCSYIDGNGVLRVEIDSSTGANFRALSVAGFRAAYSGQWVWLHVTWDGAAAPSVYINGAVAITTETTGGTPPAWSQAVDDDNFTLGIHSSADRFTGRLVPYAPINRVLSASEVSSWATTGRPPADCETTTGSMIPLVGPSTNTGGFETAGAGGNDVFAAWVESASGSGVIADETTTIHAGSHSAKLSISAVSSSWAIVHIPPGTLIPGNRYRIEFWARTDGTGATLLCQDTTTSADYLAPTTLTTTWTKYTSEFTAASTQCKLGVSSSSQAMVAYLDDVTITPLGPLFRPIVQPIAILDDGSSNKLAGIAAAGVTPLTNRRDWRIVATTATNGNQQLLGAAVFFNTNNQRLDNWVVVNAGTSETVSLGNASGGTQYLSSGTEAAGPNDVTLATRFNATTSLWCTANGTATLTHVITGHLVQ